MFKRFSKLTFRIPRSLAIVGLVLLVAAPPSTASAIQLLQVQNPQSNSFGLAATKSQAPPDKPATIVTPGNGSNFSTNPITVSGLCPDDLLIQVYDNNVLAGSANCKNGSFSLQITLFSGQNDIYAIDYDDLNQAGPESNHVTVSFNNASVTSFGQLITLTSNFGRRAASPGTTLTWPILLSGGTGPYAFSIDWGDGKAAELKSQQTAGEVDLSHVYDKSGIYTVVIKVTDANGVSAFLQLVAVANGSPTASTSGSTSGNKTVTVTRIVWLPALVCLILLVPTYWLGMRSELFILRKRLEHDMATYKDI